MPDGSTPYGGVELVDGWAVVIKTHRPPAELEDLSPVADAQQLLVAAGFQSPSPLSEPDEVEGRVVTAETLLDGSTPDGRDPGNRRLLADGLASGSTGGFSGVVPMDT